MNNSELLALNVLLWGLVIIGAFGIWCISAFIDCIRRNREKKRIEKIMEE